MKLVVNFALIFMASWFFQTQALSLSCSDTIAQAPPQVEDPMYGDWILKEARAFVEKKEKWACDPFIDFEKTVEFFDYVGFNSFFSLTPRDLGKAQVLFLVQKTLASHIMYVYQGNDTAMARIEIYKVVDNSTSYLERVKSYILPLDIEKARKHRTPAFLRFLSLTTPNAVTTGFTNTQVSFDFREDYEELETNNRGLIPPIVSAISFTKIDHANAYALFDYAGSLFPGLFLFAINQYTEVVEADPSIPEDERKKQMLRIQVYGACSNLNGQISLHSPIGTTYAALGFGPCAYQGRKENEKAKVYVDLASRVLIGHRVFTGQNIFLFFEVDLLAFQHRPLYKSAIADSNQISRSMLGLGWYVPDVERLFLKSWDHVF